MWLIKALSKSNTYAQSFDNSMYPVFPLANTNFNWRRKVWGRSERGNNMTNGQSVWPPPSLTLWWARWEWNFGPSTPINHWNLRLAPACWQCVTGAMLFPCCITQKHTLCAWGCIWIRWQLVYLMQMCWTGCMCPLYKRPWGTHMQAHTHTYIRRVVL